jgi:hypothetical protein
MPRAYRASVFDHPTREIPTRMGTVIVHRKNFALRKKDCQLKPVDLDVFALVFFQLADVAQRRPTHESRFDHNRPAAERVVN